MKNYKEFAQKFIGTSDIASLTFRTPVDAFVINFGKDNDYYAYIIEGEAEIGTHYSLITEIPACWIKVYDDNGLSFNSKNYCGIYSNLKVYRAGEQGCIIQFLE